jgi:hypothetical protein
MQAIMLSFQYTKFTGEKQGRLKRWKKSGGKAVWYIRYIHEAFVTAMVTESEISTVFDRNCDI